MNVNWLYDYLNGMRKKLGIITACIFITAIIIVPIFSAHASSKSLNIYNRFLANQDYYKSIIMYFRHAKGDVSGYSFNYKDLLLMLGADLPLSFLCLWLSLRLLSGRRGPETKNYIWFIIAVNIGRFLSFLSVYFVWSVIKYFIIALKPAWEQSIINGFYVYAILMFFIVYVWLQARTFGLSALDSLKVFFISHALYCGIVALFVFVVPNKHAVEFVDKNMGFEPIIQSYLLDVDKISKGDNMLYLARLRMYHI